MIGRSAVTRSDPGQSQLDATIEYSWNFRPAQPCRQANIKDMDCICPVRTLPSLIYPPCKYEGMNMHSLATVLCQIWGQFRWNLVLYGPKCPILRGVHQTARSPNRLIDTGLNHSASIPIWSGNISLQLQGLTLCGLVTAGRHNWIFLKFYNIFDLHRSPVDRQPLLIWSLCFLPYPSLT